MNNLTAFSKFLIILVVAGSLVGGYKFAQSKGWLSAIAPEGKQTQDIEPGSFGAGNQTQTASLDRPLRVCVVTWGGYAGGQYFNRGFKPNSDSEYKKRFGMDVEFVLMDDYNASREAWKNDKVDLLWTTADSFVTESESLEKYQPKVVFQADWSRGGDAIVSNGTINSIADLKGKKVSVAEGTPSHTFLLFCLSAGGLKYSDITVVKAPSAIDSATYFKQGKVDAAVVWSPDDEDCVKSVAGAKVLKNSKGTNIIADVFYAKKKFLDKYPESVKHLIEGWLIGAAEINRSEEAKRSASNILAAGLNQPPDFCYNAINNVRLTTYGDNVNSFNLNGNYSGVKLEELYTKMQVLYTKINLASDDAPAWRQVADTSYLRSLGLSGPEHAAEGAATFTAISQSDGASREAFSSKKVSITFDSGSAELSAMAKRIIDLEFADTARMFTKSRVRIEGNTDSTGSASLNQRLSESRAQSVANYLSQQYGFDPRRFTSVGNGANKPVADNGTAEGREQNRRTDFELLN
jgi:NitT/TauT family transport system substrate-binding protein